MGRRRVAGLAAAGLGALGGVAVLAAPVTASSPQRSAWWNEAPLGLVVSPAPAQSGQLEVGQETGSTSAVAALWYSVTSTQVPDPASAAATLSVPYVSQSSVGTPSVDACPISSTASGWKAGGNQGGGTAPAYDCSGSKGAAGQLASDGSTLIFKLNAAQLDGQNMAFDIALVPTGGTPFQAVFDVPGPNGFVVQPPTTAPVSANAAAAAGSSGAAQPQATAGSGAGAAGGGTAAPPPPVGSSGPALAGSPSLSAPSVPPTAAGAPGASANRVAAGRPTAQSARPAPSRSGGLFGGRRQQVLGLWIMLDTAAVLFLFASGKERAPRLLGSMAARRERPGPAPEEAADESDGEVRGIGRFARPRSTPPRALT